MSAASDRIEARADALEQYGYRIHATVRRLRQRANAVALRDRPTFPNAHQREQIPAAVELALSDASPSSHHGDRVPGVDWPDTWVTWAVGWLSIQHRSPLTLTRSGARLWDFTDEEEAALLELVREAGGDVVDHWRHDTGISVRIRRI